MWSSKLRLRAIGIACAVAVATLVGGATAGPFECTWDCGDANGDVGIADFLALLAEWGGPGSCDLDGSGFVDVTDFLLLIANWGPCPL